MTGTTGTRRVGPLTAALAALTLAACGSTDEAYSPAMPIETPEVLTTEAPPAEESTTEDPPTGAPTPEASPADSPPDEPPASADDVDVIEKVKAAGAGQRWVHTIVSATQTQQDRIEVETTIVDPRGDDGSPAAQEAIAVCEGVVAVLEGEGVDEPHVSIYESDGSTYVVHGHPSYPGGCTEA